MPKFCCAAMGRWSQPCDQHTGDPTCPERIIIIRRTKSEGQMPGIRILDGGASIVAIAHCPWCGGALKSNPEYVGKRMVET